MATTVSEGDESKMEIEMVLICGFFRESLQSHCRLSVTVDYVMKYQLTLIHDYYKKAILKDIIKRYLLQQYDKEVAKRFMQFIQHSQVKYMSYMFMCHFTKCIELNYIIRCSVNQFIWI